MSTAAEADRGSRAAGGPRPARAWIVFTTVLMWAVFLQAVTAGRILSGDEWARDVHRTAAGLLFLVAVVGGDRRDRPPAWPYRRPTVRADARRDRHRPVRAAPPRTAAADGEDTLWLHVPLGVALVGILAHTSQRARRVGGPA